MPAEGRPILQAAGFFQLSLDLFCIADTQGIVRRINHAVEKTLGYAHDEIVGRHFVEFVDPEDRPAALEQLENLKTGRDTVHFECRCRCCDGSLRWLACTCPAPAADSDLLYIVARDITQQRRAQQEVVEWKNRYEVASTAAGNVVYEWNTETDEVLWGGDYERVLGYSKEELADGLEAWLARIHPEDRYDAERAIQHVLADRTPAHLQYRIRRKDGSYIVVRDDAQFFNSADRRSVRMIGFITEITQQKEAEERFRLLVEAAPWPILLVNSRGQIVFANGLAFETFGYAPGEIEGQPVERLLPERSRGEHIARREQFFEAPSVRDMSSRRDLMAIRCDGHLFPVQVRLCPIQVLSEPMVACTIVNLTERVRAEEMLLETEQRLRGIINNASAVIYVKDTSGRYLLINDQFEKLFNIRDEELRGQTDYDIFPRETADAFRENDRRVVETGETLKTEEVAPHRDGSHTYITVKFPLRDTHSRVCAVAGISTDITGLIHARRELGRLKHRMELVLNSVADGIYGYDLEGNITFVNPAAERLLGWDADALTGKPQHAISGEPAGTVVGETQPASDRDGDDPIVHGPTEATFWRRDGTTIPVEYVRAPVEDDGKTVGVVVAFRDITERRKQLHAESELRAAHVLQKQLYPTAPPNVPGFDIGGAVYPAAAACGDYFDFIRLAGDRLVIAVGDVSGHGLGSALHMVEVRAYLRAILSNETDLEAAISRLNEHLIRGTLEGSFVSLFLAEIDVRSRVMKYVGAGHDARLLRRDGRVERLQSSALVLGVMSQAIFKRGATLDVGPDDLLVIVTDGVLEARSPQKELFGPQRLVDTIAAHREAPANAIIRTVYAAVRDFAEGQVLIDDVTIVIAKDQTRVV